MCVKGCPHSDEDSITRAAIDEGCPHSDEDSITRAAIVLGGLWHALRCLFIALKAKVMSSILTHLLILLC